MVDPDWDVAGGPWLPNRFTSVVSVRMRILTDRTLPRNRTQTKGFGSPCATTTPGVLDPEFPGLSFSVATEAENKYRRTAERDHS